MAKERIVFNSHISVPAGQKEKIENLPRQVDSQSVLALFAKPRQMDSVLQQPVSGVKEHVRSFPHFSVTQRTTWVRCRHEQDKFPINVRGTPTGQRPVHFSGHLCHGERGPVLAAVVFDRELQQQPLEVARLAQDGPDAVVVGQRRVFRNALVS